MGGMPNVPGDVLYGYALGKCEQVVDVDINADFLLDGVRYRAKSGVHFIMVHDGYGEFAQPVVAHAKRT